jgi:hypothetical protein
MLEPIHLKGSKADVYYKKSREEFLTKEAIMSDLFSDDMTADQLEPLAMAFHNIVDQFPVCIRSKNKGGIRVEGNRVIDKNFTGPVLEKVLETNEVVRETPESGVYKGIPVIAAPLRNSKGECVAVMGVIDLRHAYADQ